MNATKIIRVDADVIKEIERHWKPRDTPNRVLRRLLGLDKKKLTANSEKKEGG